MKRSDDLLREILLEFEEHPNHVKKVWISHGVSDEERDRIGHIRLLLDVGYVVEVSKNNSFRLTAQGHDYLDAIRDETIWDDTKAAVAKAGGNATLEIVKAIAIGFLKKKIEDHSGMKI